MYDQDGEGVPAREWTPERKATLTAYILFLASFFVGITFLAGLILCYVKRGDCGPMCRSHMDYLIRTSWWFLGLTFLAVLTFVVGIGYFLGVAVTIWALYRYIRGLVRFLDGNPA